jgi:signal transduction histidine kinase
VLSKIRIKLTRLYTLIFGLFLLAFIAIVCIGVSWNTYRERIDEIKLLANQIARSEHSEIINYYQKGAIFPRQVAVENDYDISGQVFYYILDRNGQIIKADIPVPILREPVYNKLTNWDEAKTADFFTVILPNSDSATLALAVQKIQHDGNTIATIYAGRDVTADIRVLTRSAFTLLGASLTFLLLAAITGSFLAGKVTIPIEDSIERQKQFVADASHELRNPLSILLTSIEAIELDKGNVLSPFTLGIIRDAKEEFLRLKGLISDLLTLARADAGELKLKRELFLFETVAQQVIRSLKYAAKQKDITIKTNFNGQLELFADSKRIHQLLYILLDNAIKYSPHQSEVHLHSKPVIHNAISYIRIIVADSGPGIAPEYQNKIFHRFFRVDEARSRDVEGSGLGLAIAQYIVEAHKGNIFVQSERGKGSQFIVQIPSKNSN